MNELKVTEVIEKELELINRDSDHLAHFGIAVEKVTQSGWWVMNNTELNREVYGICRLMIGESEKIVRIVVDYDADYPFIVTRIYTGDNLRGEQGGEMEVREMDKKCIREQTTIRLPEELKEELQGEADRRTSQKRQKEVDVRILNEVKTDPDKLKDYITNTLGLEWEEPNIK